MSEALSDAEIEKVLGITPGTAEYVNPKFKEGLSQHIASTRRRYELRERDGRSQAVIYRGDRIEGIYDSASRERVEADAKAHINV